MAMNPVFLAMWMPGPFEWAMIGAVALLIFGRRLPDVARSVGKSIVEFKRGLREVKDDIDTQSRIESAPPPKPEQSGPTSEQPAPAPESNDKSTVASEPSKESSSASK